MHWKKHTTGEAMSRTTVLIDAHCVMCNGLARFLRKRVKPSVDFDIHGIDSEEGKPSSLRFPNAFKPWTPVSSKWTPLCSLRRPIRLLACGGTMPCGSRWRGGCPCPFAMLRIGLFRKCGTVLDDSTVRCPGPKRPAHDRKHRCLLGERWCSLPWPRRQQD